MFGRFTRFMVAWVMHNLWFCDYVCLLVYFLVDFMQREVFVQRKYAPVQS